MPWHIPRKFEKAEDFVAKAEEYFEKTPVKEQTRAGLCVYLGMSTDLLLQYKKGEKGEDFKEAALWVYTRLEHKYEVDLNLRANPTGPIFALKQYGWKDNQDVEVKSAGFEIVCNIPRPEEK